MVEKSACVLVGVPFGLTVGVASVAFTVAPVAGLRGRIAEWWGLRNQFEKDKKGFLQAVIEVILSQPSEEDEWLDPMIRKQILNIPNILQPFTKYLALRIDHVQHQIKQLQSQAALSVMDVSRVRDFRITIDRIWQTVARFYLAVLKEHVSRRATSPT